MPQVGSGRRRSPDLHGTAPDSCPVALLLVDVINEFAFEGAEPLSRGALRAARHIASLRVRARRSGVPCIFVNDNFGRWRSDFNAVVEHCGRTGSAGAPIVKLLQPGPQDYFVLKPKHSGFYETSLSILLAHLETRTLIITGFSAESCVAFTAHDAYLRDLSLVIPRDTTASCSRTAKRVALAHLGSHLKAKIPQSEVISFTGRGPKLKLLLNGTRML